MKWNSGKYIIASMYFAASLFFAVDLEAWDNWSNWSTCSVTCGQGKQVRWRHCKSEDCIRGLKKAQLRNCRLKNCKSKGFLRWLGLKSRVI